MSFLHREYMSILYVGIPIAEINPKCHPTRKGTAGQANLKLFLHVTNSGLTSFSQASLLQDMS